MIKTNLKQVVQEIKQINRTHYNAMRKAMRRSLSAVNKKAWEISKARYFRLPKLTKKEKISSFADRTKHSAWRESPMTMKTEFKANTHEYSAIHSIKGQRKPQNQKGIKVAQRKSLRATFSGQTKTLNSQFIAAPKKTRGEGVLQAFTRGKKKKGAYGQGLMKQSSMSVLDLLSLTKNKKALQHAAEQAAEGAIGEVSWH